MDLRFLNILLESKGRPLGLSTISAALSEDEGTVEDVIEPYLLAKGYIERTARGRIATPKCYELFRLNPAGQGLFE
jgi:Holliday junction DNA helicase RuvB